VSEKAECHDQEIFSMKDREKRWNKNTSKEYRILPKVCIHLILGKTDEGKIQ
jgi:hypothetical protein